MDNQHHHHHDMAGNGGTHHHHHEGHNRQLEAEAEPEPWGGGHEGMMMYFHGGYTEVILFDFWRIDSVGGLVGSMFACFFGNSLRGYQVRQRSCAQDFWHLQDTAGYTSFANHWVNYRGWASCVFGGGKARGNHPWAVGGVFTTSTTRFS